MEVSNALRIANQLIFWPGWRIRAEAAGWMGGTTITVITDIDTIDTNREYAPLYRKPRTIHDEFDVDVADLDEDGLLYAILENYKGIHEHEDREALRRGDRALEAPFHPHRPEGQLRWARQERSALLRIMERVRR
jgi:hypothetical protein